MDKELARYLNDHLAGSAATLPLIQELADKHEAPEAREFFLHFKEAVKADQLVLEDLLERIGQDPCPLHKVAGGIAARITNIKLMWEKVEPGKLGRLEALDILALGVEGNRLLWAALHETALWIPEWEGIDFVELDVRAIQHRDDIEFWRIHAAKSILADAKRRPKLEVKTDSC